MSPRGANWAGVVGAAVAGGLVVACARGPITQPVAPTPVEQPAVRQTITTALTADAAMDDADSLYIIGAIVVADGRTRQGAPRFAGVRAGGRTTVTGVALEITPYLAWASVDYRWSSRDGAIVVVGRATFVLERFGGAWRIKHAHSSSVRAGDAGR